MLFNQPEKITYFEKNLVFLLLILQKQEEDFFPSENLIKFNHWKWFTKKFILELFSR